MHRLAFLPRPRALRAVVHALAVSALVALVPACAGANADAKVHSALTETVAKHDPLALSDALETLIAEGKDTPEDRAYAYREVQMRDDGTAAYAFARAAVTGRFVQGHGLTQGPLVAEVERYARQSKTLDPGFRGYAATRLLGTLYVLAPASLLKHGNSEDGLAMLEGLVKAHPEVMENHLRVAEAYLALGDHGPAYPHLCQCIAKRDALRADDQKLLDRLIKDAGAGLHCDGANAAPAASGAPAAGPAGAPPVASSASPSAPPAPAK